MAILSSPWTAVGQLPPATRSLLLALVAVSLTVAVLRGLTGTEELKRVFRGSQDALLAFPYLVVVPGSIIWTPWTLLTAGLVEGNLLELIFSGLAVFFSGRYLERVWGQIEFLKFCAVVIVASNVGCVFLSVLQHYLLGDAGDFLYGTSFHGLMGLQTGFLVAFGQLIPEHQVQLLGGFLTLRVKQLPMIYVGISNVACILGYQSPFLLIQIGWLASWAYLRFFKWNEGSDFRGDRSDTFAFALYFPPFVQPYVARLTSFVFSLLVRLRLLPSWGPAGDVEGGYSATPGGARAEAERRRALALKALDNRLARQPAAASESAPGSSSAAPPAAGAAGSSKADEVVFDAAQES